MLSRIAENKPYELTSIENYGVIENPEAVVAASMHESYTFRETDGVAEVLVDTNADDKYKPIFEHVWPKALLKLKALCER